MASADIRELKKDEAIAGAALQVDIPALSRAQHEAAQAIRTKVDKDDPRTITDKLAVKSIDIPALDALHHSIDKNIHYEVDKSAGPVADRRDRDAGERARLNRGKEAATKAHYLLEKGYANLPDADTRVPIDKQRIRAALLPDMKRIWPELNTTLATMSLTEQQTAMDALLIDDRFQKRLVEIMNRLQTEGVEGLEKADYKAAKDALEEAERKRTHAVRAHTAADTEKNRYDTGGDKLRDLTTEVPEPLADLRASLARLDGELNNLKNEKTVKQGEVDYWRQLSTQARIPDDDRRDAIAEANRIRRDELNPIIANVSSKESEIAEVKRKISLREEFDRDKKKAEEEEKRTQKELEEATHTKDQAQTEMYIKEADMALNKGGRAASEDAYIKKWEKAVTEAAEQVLVDRIKADEAARDKLVEDVGKDQLTDGLRRRWVNADGSYDEAAIEHDFHSFIGNHLDDVMVDMLVVQGRMNRAQAQEKLRTDPEFAKDTRRQVAEQLMTRYLQTGHKLSENEINYIMDSEVGKEVIGSSLAKRAEYQAQLDALKKEGLVPEEWSWTTILNKLPEVNRQQLMKLALGGAGLFLGGPYLGSILWPIAQGAASRWDLMFKTGLTPPVTLPGVGTIGGSKLPGLGTVVTTAAAAGTNGGTAIGG